MLTTTLEASVSSHCYLLISNPLWVYNGNRFRGLDLVDRVPEELWMEVHNTVQEAVTKSIPKKKKSKKSKLAV